MYNEFNMDVERDFGTCHKHTNTDYWYMYTKTYILRYITYTCKGGL